ncbi:MAG: hypothetical protein RIS52_805 [Pseudomonadota bacterium]|jgi:pilus assembly protein Flp/PilA
MFKLIRCLVHDKKAATAIEYGLIASLVVLAMVTGMKGMAGGSTSMWGNVMTKVDAAMP